MSRLKKKILRGDFDESSSDDDQKRTMVQQLTILEIHRLKGQQSEDLNANVECHRQHIYRDRVSANKRLIRDNFVENPVHLSNIFHRRFRMNRLLFLRILNTIQQHGDYFILKHDVAGVLGLSGLQKMIMTLRILTYGVPADAVDEYVSIGESTALKSLKRFC